MSFSRRRKCGAAAAVRSRLDFCGLERYGLCRIFFSIDIVSYTCGAEQTCFLTEQQRYNMMGMYEGKNSR